MRLLAVSLVGVLALGESSAQAQVAAPSFENLKKCPEGASPEECQARARIFDEAYQYAMSDEYPRGNLEKNAAAWDFIRGIFVGVKRQDDGDAQARLNFYKTVVERAAAAMGGKPDARYSAKILADSIALGGDGAKNFILYEALRNQAMAARPVGVGMADPNEAAMLAIRFLQIPGGGAKFKSWLTKFQAKFAGRAAPAKLVAVMKDVNGEVGDDVGLWKVSQILPAARGYEEMLSRINIALPEERLAMPALGEGGDCGEAEMSAAILDPNRIVERGFRRPSLMGDSRQEGSAERAPAARSGFARRCGFGLIPFIDGELALRAYRASQSGNKGLNESTADQSQDGKAAVPAGVAETPTPAPGN